MIVRVGMAPRRTGMTIAEFQHHWRHQHGDAAARIPGLRTYVQNHAVLRDGHSLEPYPGFDACSEIGFDSVEAMDEGFASEVYRNEVTADETDFIDRERFMMVLGERFVRRDHDPPPGAVKLLTFLRCHPGVGKHVEWTGGDQDSARAELVAVLEGPYTDAMSLTTPLRQEHIVARHDVHERRLPAACDVIDIVWFASPDAATAALRSDAGDTAGLALAGRAFGAARLVASPFVVR